MKIECLIEREGATPVSVDNVTYTFQPIPRFAKRKDGKLVRVAVTTSMCDVQSDEHIKYLLGRKQFIPYDENEAARIVEEEVNDFVGFSIEKCGESGYMVVDRRLKAFKYAGQDGNWKDAQTGIKAFNSQMDADGWLKDLHEMGDLPGVETKKK